MKYLAVLFALLLLPASASAQIMLEKISPFEGQTGLSPDAQFEFYLTDDCDHPGDCGVQSTYSNTRILIRRSQNPQLQDKDLAVTCSADLDDIIHRRFVCRYNIANFCQNTDGVGPVEIIIDAVDLAGNHYVFDGWHYETTSGNHFTSDLFPLTQIFTTPLSDTETLLTSFTYGFYHDLDVTLRDVQGEVIGTYSSDESDGMLELSRAYFTDLEPETQYEYTAILTDYCGNTFEETNSFFSSASPSISSLSSNDFVQGNDITIYGSGFGIKDPVEPFKWDDFETGVDGETVTGWSTVNNPHYSHVRSRVPGEQVLEQIYSQATGANQQIGLSRASLLANIYATWWAYRDDFAGTATCSDNQKLNGNFGWISISGSTAHPQQRSDQYSYYQGGHLYTSDYTGGGSVQDYYGFDGWLNNWHRVERYSNTMTRESYAYLKKNREMIAEINGDFLGSDYHYYTYFIIGQFVRLSDSAIHNPATCSAELKNYIGEIYIDTTPARVELCDGSDWSSASHCEIQIPHTTWNDGEISFEVNMGTFTGDEDLYVFVIDQEEDASNGFSIAGSTMSGPRISSISGDFVHGMLLNISGTGFGNKDPVSPWLWDDFDDGVIGQNVSDDISLIGDIPYEFYSYPAEYQTLPGGSVGVYYYDSFGPPDNGSTARGNIVVWNQATQKRYVSYDLFVNDFGSFEGISPTELGVWKLNRQTSNLHNGNDNAPYDDAPNFGFGQTIYYNNCADFVETRWCDDPIYSDCDFPSLNNWHRIEAYEKMSNTDISDGAYFLWYDRSLKYGSDSIMTCSSSCTNGCQIDTWMSPVLVNDMSAEEIMIDNLYIDNTQARVELCDSSDWNTASHCEIQIPQDTWDPMAIKIMLNKGSFTASDDLWLFVVDADGLVSDGFGPLQFVDNGISYSPGDLNRDGVVNLEDLDSVHSIQDLLILGRNLFS